MLTSDFAPTHMSAADRAGARCLVIPADKGSPSFGQREPSSLPSEGTLDHSRNGPCPDD
jgi:hypothetical protein